MKAPWRDYEDLARERRPPPQIRPMKSERARIAGEICEWLARNWPLALLLLFAAIAAICAAMEVTQ